MNGKIMVKVALITIIFIGCASINKHSEMGVQSKVKMALGATYVSQLSYFVNNNTYTGDANNVIPLTLKNYQGIPYSIYISKDSWFDLSSSHYSLPSGITVGANDISFTAVAVGNIDDDSTLDIWSINDSKVLNNLSNDIDK